MQARGLIMVGGYAGKILRIDLTRKLVRPQRLPIEIIKSFIGGRGLATKLFYEETSFNANPLDPGNNLIFMTGPFAGTIVPCSSRYSVTSKSPLTGLWASSDSGGSWGQELKFAGYDGIIFSGKAEEPVYTWICEENVEIRSACHVWGEDTYRTDEILRKETDERAVVACIGPAGEKLVKFASIVNDGKHARVAGRAGLGAVMGAKNLKAVVVRGTREPEVSNMKLLEVSVKEILPKIVNNTKGLSKYGTSVLVEPCEASGDLPIKNWRQGHWKEAAKISGDAMARSILVGRYYCSMCVIGCGRMVRITEGKYATVDGAGPEYESIAALGSLCLVDNLEVIAKANELCNRYGMDTISTGSIIAFAMEAFEKKLISKEDVDGLDLMWGNGEAVIKLIKMIGEKRGIGKVLCEGVRTASAKIGGNAVDFAIHIKGLELPMHDPRCYASLAVGYGTANRGACHLEAFSHIVERTTTLPEFGYEKTLDPYSSEGKGSMVAKLQNLMSILDSLPLCKFACMFGKIPIATLVDWLNAITGWTVTMEELLRSGERIFNLARLYNVHCGISAKDDIPPARILVNKRKDRGEATNLPHIGKMLNEYYEFRGWSMDGIPTIEKLEELGLPIDLPPQFVRHRNEL